MRRAIAYAIDVQPIIHYLLRDEARPAYSVLPPQHWAYDGDVARYPHDPERARKLLDDAGYRRGQRRPLSHHDEDVDRRVDATAGGGAAAAIARGRHRARHSHLRVRDFLSDVTKGAYQIHSLRWVGGNLDPDIFEHVFDTEQLRAQARESHLLLESQGGRTDSRGPQHARSEKRKCIYDQIQQILADDLPYINLWYLRQRIGAHQSGPAASRLDPSGNYDFLRTAELER